MQSMQIIRKAREYILQKKTVTGVHELRCMLRLAAARGLGAARSRSGRALPSLFAPQVLFGIPVQVFVQVKPYPRRPGILHGLPAESVKLCVPVALRHCVFHEVPKPLYDAEVRRAQ